ncbi:MAG: hypothetical protein HOH19_06060 [Kordiimonadaceae bacterium]|jgi:hypothetical protein|nr:hypothetical protein [Kordiimonadaceae bacterium]MBT6032121.1 hypothetical protein [Kordiimonadaceae bacterium]
MMKTKEQIFKELRPLIAEAVGVKTEKIILSTSFLKDLGVTGDDGDYLFDLFKKKYDFDWEGLDLGILFGNEGFGPVFPTMLDKNCDLYIIQPCIVEDVVKAILKGKWEPTPLIKKSQFSIVCVYISSCLFHGLFYSLVIFIIAVVFYKYLVL